MKRISILFSGTNAPLNALAVATKIAKQQSIPVIGIFLQEPKEGYNSGYPFPNDLPLAGETLSQEEIKAEDSKDIDDNIKVFKDECEAKGVMYTIEKDISIDRFLQETTGTDLIVTNTRADFLEKVLPYLSCPACLVSESELPEKTTLLYDGSDSCKHALKMYASFFPDRLNIPTSVVSLNLSEIGNREMESTIENDLQPHFTNLSIQHLQGNKEEELIAFLGLPENDSLVVMGAFGRSAFSRFFRESLAFAVMENTRCSLFIAHE